MPLKPYVAALLILDPAMTAMGCARTAWAIAEQEAESTVELSTADELRDRGHIAVARFEVALAGLSRLAERGAPSV